MSEVTRFPNGVVANSDVGINRDLPVTNPARTYVHFEDFAAWPSSSVDAFASGALPYGLAVIGTSDIVALDEDSGGSPPTRGGRVRFETGAALGNGAALFGSIVAFELLQGVPVWFECRLQIDDLQTQLQIGLTNDESTVPLADDGFFFLKAVGSDQLDFVCTHNSSTEIQESAGSLVLDEDVVLGFYFDGETITWANNGLIQGSAVIDPALLPLGPVDITALFGTGEASAHNMILDYFWGVTEDRG